MTATVKTGMEKLNTFMENSKWVLAIVGALWAVYEYYHNDYMKKVDRTQAYISDNSYKNGCRRFLGAQ